MIDRVLSLAETIALAIVMMALYIFLYDMRINTPSEIYYAWFPVLIAAIYGWLWYRNNRIYEDISNAPAIHGDFPAVADQIGAPEWFQEK